MATQTKVGITMKTLLSITVAVAAFSAMSAFGFMAVSGAKGLIYNNSTGISPSAGCGFYNEYSFDDPIGDAASGSPTYVDVKNFKVRQLGQYVQFVWEGNGDLRNNDQQYYFIVFDADLNSNTGQRSFGGIGGELKISVYHGANLTYFDAGGNVVREDNDLPVVFDGNKFYLNLEKTKIPSKIFNLYFESSGGTPYSDSGSVQLINLVDATTQVSPKYNINLDSSYSSQYTSQIIKQFKITGGLKAINIPLGKTAKLLFSNNGAITATLPSNLKLFSSVDTLSVKGNLVSATGDYSQLRDLGDILAVDQCYFIQDRMKVAEGDIWQGKDNTIVYPGNMRSVDFPGQSQCPDISLKQMIDDGSYIKANDLAYQMSKDLYFGGDQNHLPWDGYPVLYKYSNGENASYNQLYILANKYYLMRNCHLQYNFHELGHGFTLYNDDRLSKTLDEQEYYETIASFGPCYIQKQIVDHHNQYNISDGVAQNIADSICITDYQDNRIYDLINTYEADPNFDRLMHGSGYNEFIYAVVVKYARENANPNIDVIKRFFRIYWPDVPMSLFTSADTKDKKHTFFVASISAAVGRDLRNDFRAWSFPVDDNYFDKIYKKMNIILRGN